MKPFAGPMETSLADKDDISIWVSSIPGLSVAQMSPRFLHSAKNSIIGVLEIGFLLRYSADLYMSHTNNSKETIETKGSCKPLEAITFLDTTCKIENGKILFDLYKKTN